MTASCNRYIPLLLINTVAPYPTLGPLHSGVPAGLGAGEQVPRAVHGFRRRVILLLLLFLLLLLYIVMLDILY